MFKIILVIAAVWSVDGVKVIERSVEAPMPAGVEYRSAAACRAALENRPQTWAAVGQAAREFIAETKPEGGVLRNASVRARCAKSVDE